MAGAWRWLPTLSSAEVNDRVLHLYSLTGDSSVGTATGYSLEGPGIESLSWRDFPHLSRPALGPTQPPLQWIPVLFRGGKAAEAWRWPTTPSSAEVKEREQLYLYSPSGPSRPVTEWPLALPDLYFLSGTSWSIIRRALTFALILPSRCYIQALCCFYVSRR